MNLANSLQFAIRRELSDIAAGLVGDARVVCHSLHHLIDGFEE